MKQPLRKLTFEDKVKILEDYIGNSMPIKTIAKKYNVHAGMVAHYITNYINKKGVLRSLKHSCKWDSYKAIKRYTETNLTINYGNTNQTNS